MSLMLRANPEFPDLNEGGCLCSVWCFLFGLVGLIVGASIQGAAERFGLLKGQGMLPRQAVHPSDDCLKQEDSAISESG